MAGGDHERGRGYDRGRGRNRWSSHGPGRGSGYSPDNRSSSHSPAHSSSSSGSSSSSYRDQRRLEAEHAPPSSERKFDFPILQGKPKPKPKRVPNKDEEYADVVRCPSQQNPSPRSSATRNTAAHRVGELTKESDEDIFNAKFPTLKETHERSRASKSPLAGNIPPPPAIPAESPQNPPPPPTEPAGSPQNPPPPPPDEETALKERFRKLLNNSRRFAEGGISYYQAMGERNASLKQETLKVHFDDLLKEKYYMDLAIKIKEKSALDPEHSWLQPVVSEFLNTWFNYDTRQDKRRLRFRFIREPKSILPLSAFTKEVVVKKQSLYDGQYEIVRTTKTGRLVYLSVLNNVLTIHKKRKSYKGNFEEKDIYILEYNGKGRLRCVILARRTEIYEDDFNERILDLQGVNTVLTPRYELDGEFPAFFPDLQSDLEGLTRSSLEDSGMLTVLPFHYAVMSPGAWGFLIWKLHLVIQQLKASGSDFTSVFGQRVNGASGDWRLAFRTSQDQVVKGVYGHDNNSGQDKFTNDLGGMCDCDRHLVQHAHHHPKNNPVRVRRKDENELFAAKKMPLVVPSVIRGLFSGKEMKFKEELGDVYADFCKLCYDADEDVDEDYED